MTMFASVFSRFSAFCGSGVKLLFGNEVDCKVEVTLLLMLSLVDSDSSFWWDRTASTLDTIASVGICLGVTGCLSPWESTCVSVSSKRREEIFLTPPVCVGFTSFSVFCVLQSCQFFFDLLTRSSKTNYERTTGELTIWLTIDDCLTVTIDGSKRTNYWLRAFVANKI